ncbi:MAG: acetoacetate--CoA ligase [Thermoanaerobaculia bacterium]|nr:acetoacetate--CoA ligase [Thermoanaerobaculia bacterium]
MADIVWTPTAQRVASARLTEFLRGVSVSTPGVVDYPSLWRWSVEDPAAFWRKIWQEADIVASAQPEATHAEPLRMLRETGHPGADWFPGARLNFAENLLRHGRGADSTHPAIVAWNEMGRQSVHTYGELRREVAEVGAALRRLGVGPGDRVAGFLPNIPETVVAMLAATSLGAVWSSCSPDFGTRGVYDRFGQIEPKVLFCADGYRFGGKVHDSLTKVAGVVERIVSIEAVVVVPYLEPAPDLGAHTALARKACLWTDFAVAEGETLDFAQLPFGHPVYVLYSSGTTGLPKCMVHGAGGTLLQHWKELVLHTDLGPEDRIFYFTTCGWMMWNWLVSSLMVGATVLLYDGSPLKPKPNILFDLAESEGMTIFGTSAKYLAMAEKEGLVPKNTYDLSTLRTVLSTGSPLAPESYDWVYEQIGEDLQLSSISGGTDLVSCFALGNPTAPVVRGELQSCGLGMSVEIWDDDGRPLPAGQPGELVCTKPFPSMPVAFWNDPDGSKYRNAYFEHYPDVDGGVWRHGDWAEITDRGGLVIHGRSDATLNPGGVRIGTAEIYRQVEQIDEILESLVIGQRWRGDVRIVLFVRLRSGRQLTDELRDGIRRRVRAHASPHHVPKKIVQVADIPKTLSGKITELAVRRIVHGEAVRNHDALANAESLELFRDLAELQTD